MPRPRSPVDLAARLRVLDTTIPRLRPHLAYNMDQVVGSEERHDVPSGFPHAATVPTPHRPRTHRPPARLRPRRFHPLGAGMGRHPVERPVPLVAMMDPWVWISILVAVALAVTVGLYGIAARR